MRCRDVRWMVPCRALHDQLEVQRVLHLPARHATDTASNAPKVKLTSSTPQDDVDCEVQEMVPTRASGGVRVRWRDDLD